MSPDIEQIRSLVRRATHADTPPEEARSCAVIACKRIAANHLLSEQAAPAESDSELAVLAQMQQLQQRARQAVAQRDERIRALQEELRKAKREVDDARFEAQVTSGALAAITTRGREKAPQYARR